MLAAITAFYDIQRGRSADFFIYPDYFLFHVGRELGDHGQLDVWPAHKEVVVADEPEELLRAINDRGITRLVVEDGTPGDGGFAPETLASARGRIVTALAYSADGTARDADVAIAGNDVTECYVAGVLDRSAAVPGADRDRIASARRRLLEDGRPVERYRRIGLEEALGLLAPEPERRLAAVGRLSLASPDGQAGPPRTARRSGGGRLGRRLGRRRVERRQSHDEARPGVGVLELDVAAVRLGHRAHDRQPEPRRAAAVAVAAHEPLEDLLAQRGGHAGPVVLDREHHVAARARPRWRGRGCPAACGGPRSPSG